MARWAAMAALSAFVVLGSFERQVPSTERFIRPAERCAALVSPNVVVSHSAVEPKHEFLPSGYRCIQFNFTEQLRFGLAKPPNSARRAGSWMRSTPR